jgi:hypothetical protein
LGSEQYQSITSQAILRFWTLTAYLMAFLEEQRALSQDTCGDARSKLQNDHQKNMLRWLEYRFKTGASIDQIFIQLAL